MSPPGDKKQLKLPTDPDSKKISSPLPEKSSTLSPALKLDSKGVEGSASVVIHPPRVTRSNVKSSVDTKEMSLESFIAACDRLNQFEAMVSSPSTTNVTISMLRVRHKQVLSLWEKIEEEYALCSVNLSSGTSSDDLPALKAKYEHCYMVYERCSADLDDKIKAATSSVQRSESASTSTSTGTPASRGFNLPPCDTEVFNGDYERWPTFRDLFKAIYVDNTRLTSVEKLFHLNAKTSGDAKAIVSSFPLTNESFDSAWEALKERFENKRLLVNSQWKILFNLTAVTVESGSALKELQSTIQGCLTTLNHSKIPTTNWDSQLVYLCSGKLPEVTLSLWEQSLPNKAEIPTWAALNSFLIERYRTLEAISDLKPSISAHNLKPARKEPPPKRLNSFEAKVNVKAQTCKLCSKENHPVRLCQRFLQMAVNERSSFIKQQRLCLNCFARGHQVKDCTSQHNCFTCKGRHNTLLHRGGPLPMSSTSGSLIPNSQNQTIQSTPSSNVQSYFTANAQGVLLGTAIINICHLGTSYKARALIDSGSEATFISERMFNLIKPPFQPVVAQVSGLNQAIAAKPQKLCHFNIGSPIKPRIQIETSAFVLPNVAGTLPSYPIPQSFLRDLPNLQLADPSFYRSSQIDVLLGADILPSIILGGLQPNICGSLLGQETIFGWILTGPVTESNPTSIVAYTTRVTIKQEERLESLLNKFWEVEDLPAMLVNESDSVCEDNFVRTTTRNENGRYVVSLPFRNPDHINLGHSRSIALAQFLKNESRLKRNIPLKEQYDSVIQEYLDLGHMKQVPPSNDSNNFYLPHHAVFKPESTTTKIRIVFNASCPTSNGKSLNDILHPGPVLQSDLTIQILKWRFFQYVFNADITKMYRQIMLDPKQTQFQRILFRNKDDELCDYELTTVTFGVNCAPFLAIRVLKQLAQDELVQHPRASDIISNSMYVDDVLAGAHTKHEAIMAIKELRSALDSAGFPLRKWTSNTKELVQDIPKDHLLCADFLEIDDASTTKTLGVRWQATTDEFFFVPSDITIKSSFTKREVLSQISKLFDPAGWLAPFIVRAKIFMQEIWLKELDWDESLPSDLLQRWQDYLQSYPLLKEIRVPRWIHFHPKANLQYHGFCDASQRAYGAAIYVRVETESEVSIHLLTAKTRVAPVKTISLPRLELCGAVLLAELSAVLLPQLHVDKFESYYWTDSTIVLAWLDKSPCKWTTFVANRVAKIAQSVKSGKWSHIRSEDNPADLASRGVAPSDLASSSLWWHGPEWLRRSQDQWPIPVGSVHETDLEQRPVKCNFSKVPQELNIIERFSEFGKTLRVVAYVLRFLRRCRKPDTQFPKELSSSELSETQERLIAYTQHLEYPKEYQCLISKQTIPTTSSILNLNPFLDQKGIIRACGRVRASESLNYDERHPIILPYSCAFTRLLVRFTHRISLHGGNQLMMRLIRAKYWIPKLRNLVKSTINSCRTCVIHRKKLQTQLMGDLPVERTTFSRPFTHTGVDFAGPFDIKNYTGRACLITKGYVCVFVCFSTKAIHLEATSDLTTEKFLSAFARFVARRGCPQQVFSDNGKTFVGASKTLSRDFLEAAKTSVISTYSHQNLSWRFNPPSAPHMGGLWEAGVKSFKTLFYKSTSSFKFTFEELSTLLSKIEACLNSRPISPMSEDPTDLLALSPGHFLIGGPLLSVAEPQIKDKADSIINRWRRLKALNQQFCFRWKEEYLKELHKRNKWQLPTRNLQSGDMVVIKEDNLPFNEWRLGRIEQTYPGSDDRVRVVDVLTTRGTIKRPVAKLILLPTEPNVHV